MKIVPLIFLCIVCHSLLWFAQIRHRTQFYQLDLCAQRNQKLLDQLSRYQEQLQIRYYAVTDLRTTKKIAQDTLKMVPISLSQFKKIDEACGRLF